jgi:hypothetical protein
MLAKTTQKEYDPSQNYIATLVAREIAKQLAHHVPREDLDKIGQLHAAAMIAKSEYDRALSQVASTIISSFRR